MMIYRSVVDEAWHTYQFFWWSISANHLSLVTAILSISGHQTLDCRQFLVFVISYCSSGANLMILLPHMTICLAVQILCLIQSTPGIDSTICEYNLIKFRDWLEEHILKLFSHLMRNKENRYRILNDNVNVNKGSIQQYLSQLKHWFMSLVTQ